MKRFDPGEHIDNADEIKFWTQVLLIISFIILKIIRILSNIIRLQLSNILMLSTIISKSAEPRNNATTDFYQEINQFNVKKISNRIYEVGQITAGPGLIIKIGRVSQIE